MTIRALDFTEVVPFTGWPQPVTEQSRELGPGHFRPAWDSSPEHSFLWSSRWTHTAVVRFACRPHSSQPNLTSFPLTDVTLHKPFVPSLSQCLLPGGTSLPPPAWPLCDDRWNGQGEFNYSPSKYLWRKRKSMLGTTASLAWAARRLCWDSGPVPELSGSSVSCL